MTIWHRTKQADLALRAAGVVLCAVSWAGIAELIARTEQAPAHGPDLLAFCLAIVGFLAASAGSGLLLLGGHIFDQVEVSDRWRRRGATAVRRGDDQPAVGWREEQYR